VSIRFFLLEKVSDESKGIGKDPKTGKNGDKRFHGGAQPKAANVPPPREKSKRAAAQTAAMIMNINSRDHDDSFH
jgi:proteasome lid subunit RPN8/RPN11